MISGYRSLMTLLAVLTPAFFLINQGKAATLEGTVRNICSHQIVAGATVEAVGATTETTTTDANGFFQFSDLLEGEVALSVSAIGFKSETAIVEVVGEATNADVDLLPISFCEIECDADGDVDGADLGLMAAGYSGGFSLEEFAGEFGRPDCPFRLNNGDTCTTIPLEVAAVVGQVSDLYQTFALRSSSGAVIGVREGISSHFPEIVDLIGGGPRARDFMLKAFEGTASFSQDMELSIYAYALEFMGDPEVIVPLQAFILNNLNSDLYFALHFVTQTVKTLRGDTDLEDTFYYTGHQMLDVATGQAALTGEYFADSSSGTPPKSCTRRYVLLDHEGKPIVWTDANGNPHEAFVEGNTYADAYLPDTLRALFLSSVPTGNGTFVHDDPEFSGEPSKLFNCAGYAFRHFNGGKKWTADPTVMHKVLVTQTGLLEEVNAGEEQPGDIVFYIQPSGVVGHVAILQRITFWGTRIVRNADGQSGLWEAAIDAAYFKGVGGAEAKYPSHKIYRWKNGAPPAVKADPSVIGNQIYCMDSLSTDITFQGQGPYVHVWVDYDGVIMNHRCESITDYEVTFLSSGTMEIEYDDNISMEIDWTGDTYTHWSGATFGVVCSSQSYPSHAYGTHFNGTFTTFKTWYPEGGGITGHYDETKTTGKGEIYYRPAGRLLDRYIIEFNLVR